MTASQRARLTKFQIWLGKASNCLLLIGGGAILACLVFISYADFKRPNVDKESCKRQFAPSLLETTDEDKKGQLRFVGFWPDKFGLNQRLCVAVAGVVDARLSEDLERSKRELTEADNAYRKVAKEEKALKDSTAPSAQAELVKRGADVKSAEEKRKQAQQQVSIALIALNASAPVDLAVYLDNRRVQGVNVKAKPVSKVQYLFFDFKPSAQAETAEAKFWRALFGLSLTPSRSVAIGLSRAAGAADIPQVTVKDSTGKAKTATLIIFLFWPSLSGAVALVSLVAWLISFGATSTLLRDGPLCAGEVETAKLRARVEQATSAVKAAEANFAAKQSAPQPEKDAAELELKNARANKQKLEDDLRDEIAKAAKTLTDAEADVIAKIKDLNDKKSAKPQSKSDVDAAKTALWDAQRKVKDIRQPAGTFSLGRVQMAVWFVLSLAGFCFIWLTTGQFIDVITPQILLLLGIQVATGLTALQLNDDAAARRTTRGFLTDILSDGDDLKLQRLQVVAWTCILAIIFAWTVLSSFTFPSFDSNLLLLMGIFNSTYLGFKFAEKK